MAKISDKGLIVRKVGMTRMIDAAGKMVPVTLLKVEEQSITKVLTPERDGYHGFQVGYFAKAEKNLGKADLNRLRKCNIEQNYSEFTEFRTADAISGFEVGKLMTAELFRDVASIDVRGITKGRGFQGAVKRWGSTIGRMTHGSRFHRRPGSLGSNTTPGRVFKNKHQPGHMGCEARTVRNVKVLDVNLDANVIAIKGSVPGHRAGALEIRPSNKK